MRLKRAWQSIGRWLRASDYRCQRRDAKKSKVSQKCSRWIVWQQAITRTKRCVISFSGRTRADSARSNDTIKCVLGSTMGYSSVMRQKWSSKNWTSKSMIRSMQTCAALRKEAISISSRSRLTSGASKNPLSICATDRSSSSSTNDFILTYNFSITSF